MRLEWTRPARGAAAARTSSRSSRGDRSASCSTGTPGTRSGTDPPTRPSPASRAPRVEQLRRPEVRARILDEQPVTDDAVQAFTQAALTGLLPQCFVLGDEPDYEQPQSRSLGAIAACTGTAVEAVAYDALLEGNATAMLLLPLFNYADANHDALYEQMQDPAAVLGLADGGAHCGAICRTRRSPPTC